MDLANWNWKVVHRFVWERFGFSLCRSSCLTYMHAPMHAPLWDLPSSAPRSGLLKGDEEKREAFVVGMLPKPESTEGGRVTGS